MTPYRTSTRIKLGLIVAAVAIALASLAFTQRLADRLEAQDEQAVEVWARAIEYQFRVSAATSAPDPEALEDLEAVIAASDVSPDRRRQLAAALDSLRNGPPSDGLDFVFSEIIEPSRFSVPAIVTDTGMTAAAVARNVDDGDDLLALARAMDEVHPPISVGGGQLVHYGESPLARLIRLFPVVQLGVVALFVLVGYLGFSYVRRSEQSSLWVGMAREAAHQLGTPLSSIMGWIELLRLGDAAEPEMVADELEHDVDRLRRVADRFEKIGSRPALVPTPVRPVLDRVADYIRRRVPTSAPVAITVAAPDALAARLNGELFEWVVENLLKNALDAMDGAAAPHRIAVTARADGSRVVVEVADTGRGMDRATARHVFRPGFSTKRRGWGLGLSLARRIVEVYHGGELSVAETAPGAGTTFRIVLDAAPPPDAARADSAPAGASASGSGGR